MQQDLSEIVIVLDRSGSMSSCKTDAEGGLNSFIEQQKKQPGRALFTLIQFDTEYEFVHRAKPIGEVPHCPLVPRGMTALLDAVGRGIAETGDRLSKMDEKDRPGLVVFVIITDGYENSSKEFTKERIKAMIQHQQDVYKWQFTFLGANQDAFAEAGGLGIKGAAANYTPTTAKSAFAAAAGNVSRMRACGLTGQSVSNEYTPEEVRSMSGK